MQDYVNQVICWDCLKVLGGGIKDKSIDLIITDPPYLIENTTPWWKSALAKSFSKMTKELESWTLTEGIGDEYLEEMVRVMKTINIYLRCNHKQIKQYLDFFVGKYECKFDILIRNKVNAVPLFSNKYLTDKEYCLYFRKGAYCNPQSYEEAKTVFYDPINSKDKKSRDHPTIKPLEMIKRLVNNSSKPWELILDPFLGSGTTAVACKELWRNFIGIELEERYCKIAEERLKNTTIPLF